MNILTPFKKKELADAFLKEGYCTFPFLTETEVDFIINQYNKANGKNERLQERHFYGVDYNLGTLSFEENNKWMQPIEEMINQKLQVHFSAYEVLRFAFIINPPHTGTSLFYHQDWNYTDEKKYAFITCWIPLCDILPANGGFSIINGSHNFSPTYRSISLQASRIPFEDIPQEIRTDLSLQRGTCLAFHQAALHGSYPNNSSESLIALGFLVKPRNAPILYYAHEAEAAVAYQMNTEDFNYLLAKTPYEQLPVEAVRSEAIRPIPPPPDAAAIVAGWRIHQPTHRLFRDEILQRCFVEDGFVKLQGVFKQHTLDTLQALYSAHFTTLPGMYVTHHSVTDAQQNKKISNEIFSLLQESLTDFFCNTQKLIAHFAAKAKGTEGVFNLHQDWSIVEEEIYGVLHCWVPLQDTDESNGTLAVLPKSHLLFHNYRSGTCPIRFTPISNYGNAVRHIQVRAGDMIVYHPALFHGSGENRTDIPRLAIVAALAHKEARKVYYHRNGNKVGVYALEENDLFSRLSELAKGAEPRGEFIKEAPLRALEKSDNELREFLLSEYFKLKQPSHAEI